MRLVSTVATAVLLSSPSGAAGQTVRGILLDDATGQVLDSGLVALLADSVQVAGVRTDSAGQFVLTAPDAGSYCLRAERFGYRPATSTALRLTGGDTLRVEFLLSTEVVLLDPVVVRARARRIGLPRDFYERAERGGFGRFMVREEIEAEHAVQTTHLLWRFPGVRLLPNPRGGGNTILLRGNCAPAVFLDGVRVHLYGMTVDALVRPGELEGIEVYGSVAEVPVECGGLRTGCGAILFWTRHD